MSDLGGDPACWAHLVNDDGDIGGMPEEAVTVDLSAHGVAAVVRDETKQWAEEELRRQVREGGKV